MTMVTIVLTIPSLLFLVAHASRASSPGGAFFWLAAGILAISPLPWKSWALAGLLGFGTWLWSDITLSLVQHRMALDLPWLRLAAILGAVIAVCLAAALMNFGRACGNSRSGSLVQGLAFLFTVAGLAIARQKTSLDILLLDRFFPSAGWIVVFLLGCYAAWIAGKMLRPEDSAKWRRTIWAIFSSVFFFQLFLGLLGFERFLMTGKLHLPIPALIAAGPLYRGDGFFMIILFAVTLILVGPAWCSHLCYIGAWDNLAAAGKKGVLPLPGWTRPARWLLCLMVFAVAALLGRSGQPPGLAIALASIFGVVGVVIMLTWSRRTGTMTHCTTYCPMGLLADIFGKINPWRIRIGSGCCKCGICTSICRYGALAALDIERGRAGLCCSLCGDCISGCPHGHLHYRFPGLGNDTARSAFIVVIVALHAVFLGVARL
ncbi:MAG: 4Fe-4S binding protein [Proteobacteria bacterium]|nr:4Fe-4S binding protein [Pseudomonadota bacterium]